MKRQKLKSIALLNLLLLLGLVYSAHVFVDYGKSTTQVVTTGGEENNAEENVAETAHHLFIEERLVYHLKPAVVLLLKPNMEIQTALPEAFLQLNTPPPDFA